MYKLNNEYNPAQPQSIFSMYNSLNIQNWGIPLSSKQKIFFLDTRSIHELNTKNDKIY